MELQDQPKEMGTMATVNPDNAYRELARILMQSGNTETYSRGLAILRKIHHMESGTDESDTRYAQECQTDGFILCADLFDRWENCPICHCEIGSELFETNAALTAPFRRLGALQVPQFTK